MIDFLVKYWRVIFELLMLIASIVLFILKKKPIKIVDSLKTLVIAALPDVINRVENYKDVFDPSRKLTGDEKLRMALSIVQSYLVDECGLDETELCLYRDWIIEQIEMILSTPQKKEVKHED